jgi:hypothetical protein
MSPGDNYVKILFRFYSNVLEKETVETMWAAVVDREKGLYKLDSIPFYAQSIASDDIVFAEYDEQEQMLTYRETVEYSGNSIVHVVLMDKAADINHIRDLFKEFRCASEKMNDRYFAMEIPADVKYEMVKPVLDELKEQGTIDYAEACLADGHRY